MLAQFDPLEALPKDAQRSLASGPVMLIDLAAIQRNFRRLSINQIPTDYHDPLCKRLTSMKWRLWHGHAGVASNRTKAFLFTLRLPTIAGKPPVKKLKRLVKELELYLSNNEGSPTSYGRRYRNGERITTAFMESAVNQLIDKRMSKSQQMRWSPAGAHALLQVRAELVDGKLGQTFARWYTGFEAPTTAPAVAACPLQ